MEEMSNNSKVELEVVLEILLDFIVEILTDEGFWSREVNLMEFCDDIAITFRST